MFAHLTVVTPKERTTVFPSLCDLQSTVSRSTSENQAIGCAPEKLVQLTDQRVAILELWIPHRKVDTTGFFCERLYHLSVHH